MQDMAAVAGCVAEHAKTWKLPKRTAQARHDAHQADLLARDARRQKSRR